MLDEKPRVVTLPADDLAKIHELVNILWQEALLRSPGEANGVTDFAKRLALEYIEDWSSYLDELLYDDTGEDQHA